MEKIYKFSDFIDYEGDSINSMFRIEPEWFNKAIDIITKITLLTQSSNKREMFSKITKALDEEIEITSIGQIAFLLQVIEETKNFKMQLAEESGVNIKEIYKIVTTSIDQFESAKHL